MVMKTAIRTTAVVGMAAAMAVLAVAVLKTRRQWQLQ
jgi:hypothetical protein